ncbi:MAG TPA: hypothetical protein VMV69_01855 [Pirellulales bacterium]|nr:hypothetical protein [Pirellulales bacterium]
MTHLRRWMAPLALLLALAGRLMVCAAEPNGPSDDLPRLIAGLDADRFEVRRHCGERLNELAAQTAWRERLAAAIGRALLDPETSIEVRRRLGPLAERLPKFAPEPPAELPPGEFDRLIAGLDAERFGARLGAASRLTWLIERPEWACQVIQRLKRLRGDAALSAEARQRIEPIWDAARRVWLASDPAAWRMPPVSEAEIRRWIDELVVGPSPSRTRASPATQLATEPAKRRAAARWQAAEQELLDLLARDEYLPKVKAALEARLAAGDLDAGAEGRIDNLLEWTRPMLVAERWMEEFGRGQNVLVQYLRVGEENYVTGAAHPCLFDQVDDFTAHCVSGNNLLPGTYRVGVLFPTPNALGSDAQFRLVNLPTPRRRMAYEQYLKIQESQRFAELSRRTLDDLLIQKRPLKEAELVMLEKLDAVAVSRFASGYLPIQGDPEPSDRKTERRIGRASPYQNLCCLLVEHGTREAAPGLIAALTADLFPPLAGEGACAWHWLAGLAIAQRDPWAASNKSAGEALPDGRGLPGCDEWLAGLMERTDPLSTVDAASSGSFGLAPPDLGATAAAILLARHHVDWGRFGLEWAGDRLIAEVGGPNYRFVSPAMRRKALDWWAERQRRHEMP